MEQNAAIKWWQRLWLFLAVIGVGLSLYLINHHLQIKVFGRTDAACNISEFFNCDRVAKSPFSEILGIPLGAYGLAYFTSLTVIIYWGMRFPASLTAQIQTFSVLVSAGVLTTFSLSLISFFGIGAYCIMCMSVYLVTALQGVSLFLFRKVKPCPLFGKGVLRGAPLVLMVLASILVGYYLGEKRFLDFVKDPIYESKSRHFLIQLFRIRPKVIPINLYPKDGEIGDIWEGNPNAKVVLVEYIDHLCPSCAAFAPDLKKVFLEMSDKILVVLKQFPVDRKCSTEFKRTVHPGSCDAALLAVCTWRKNKYWEFHDAVFSIESEAPIKAPPHINAAHRLGISDAETEQCLASQEALKKIQNDIDSGFTVTTRGTPAIFINGWRFTQIHSVDALRLELLYQIAKSKTETK